MITPDILSIRPEVPPAPETIEMVEDTAALADAVLYNIALFSRYNYELPPGFKYSPEPGFSVAAMPIRLPVDQDGVVAMNDRGRNITGYLRGQMRIISPTAASIAEPEFGLIVFQEEAKELEYGQTAVKNPAEGGISYLGAHIVGERIAFRGYNAAYQPIDSFSYPEGSISKITDAFKRALAEKLKNMEDARLAHEQRAAEEFGTLVSDIIDNYPENRVEKVNDSDLGPLRIYRLGRRDAYNYLLISDADLEPPTDVDETEWLPAPHPVQYRLQSYPYGKLPSPFATDFRLDYLRVSKTLQGVQFSRGKPAIEPSDKSAAIADGLDVLRREIP